MIPGSFNALKYLTCLDSLKSSGYHYLHITFAIDIIIGVYRDGIHTISITITIAITVAIVNGESVQYQPTNSCALIEEHRVKILFNRP